MFPESEKFVERDKQGAVWVYTIAFALTTMAVEPSSAESLPLFVRGAALEEGGMTASVVEGSFTFDSDDQINLPQGEVGMPREEIAARIGPALRAVGLAGFDDRDPTSLSGGEISLN
jgi:hypothetical protein